jgi:hypothetical protein
MHRHLIGLLLIAALGACQLQRREPLLTSFDADHGLSLRYPASWTNEQVAQEGIWYRYFLAPPEGPDRKPAVSVTLLSGPLVGSLQDYAELYLAGNDVVSRRQVERQGNGGWSYELSSPDDKTRHRLLLFAEGTIVYGLYAQGDAAPFERHADQLATVFESLNRERPAEYQELRDDDFGFSLRIPGSWRSTRAFSDGRRLLRHYRSPALAADPGGETVHASLTLTVEPAPEDGRLESFYAAVQERLGDSYKILSHAPWDGGYADLMHAETAVAASREKRYYRLAAGRAYSLSCGARSDVFHRASRWCDLIAGTLQTRR